MDLSSVDKVHYYDPGMKEYWDLEDVPSKVDIILCIDVMEHVEKEYLDSVLKYLSSHSPKTFFVIDTKKANHLLPDGSNAHLIVRPSSWWKERLGEYYNIEQEYPTTNDHEVILLAYAKNSSN